MSDFTDASEFLAELRSDPAVAAELDAMLADSLREQAEYRSRALSRLFAEVVSARELPVADRETTIEQTLAWVADDPGLTNVLVETLDDLVAHADAEVRELLLDAADSVTGVVPGDLRLPESLQEWFDQSPELQAFRNELPDLIDGGYSDVDEFGKSALQRVLEEHYELRPIDSIVWISPETVEKPANRETVDLLPRLKEAASAPEELVIGDQESLYLDDPEGRYRLRMTRIYAGNDAYEVRLRLYDPGSHTLLAERAEDWRVVVTLRGVTLLVIPDPQVPAAWLLNEPIRQGDLPHLHYAVALARPEQK